MTTSKFLKELYKFQFYKGTHKFTGKIDNYHEFAIRFSEYLFPCLYNRNKDKAFEKTYYYLQIALASKYIEFDEDAISYLEYITITEKAASKLISFEESHQKFISNILVAVCAGFFTILGALIAYLI